MIKNNYSDYLKILTPQFFNVQINRHVQKYSNREGRQQFKPMKLRKVTTEKY